MTRYRATLSNGDVHIVDVDAHTVTPAATNATTPLASMIGPYTAMLLETGGPVGPQVDEFAGVIGDWADPLGPLAAMIQAARSSRLSLVDWSKLP